MTNISKIFFDTVVKKTQKHLSVGAPSLPRKRNRPDYSVLQYMEGCGQGAAANHPQIVDDHFWQIYYGTIDKVVASIEDPFNQPCYNTFASLETMLLSVINDKPFEDEMHRPPTLS